MIRKKFDFEIITPCFSGGANPKEGAEIRASAIRGQLRWWFRVLGGFSSMAGKSVRDQEQDLFGSAAGDSGTGGALITRIRSNKTSSMKKDGQQLGHRNFTDPAYLTFPIQSRERGGQKTSNDGRGVLMDGGFTLELLLRTSKVSALDLDALVTVFGSLGSLGFRSRRGLGALYLSNAPLSLDEALQRFNSTAAISLCSLGDCNKNNALNKLGGWLKQWRAYGRTGQNETEQGYPGFKWAENDHHQGAGVLARRNPGGTTYRPALGLPIVQYFGSGGRTVNWEWSPEGGRFASPVLLRPHKAQDGQWHALVIFVDAKKWPEGESVYLKGRRFKVSPDLYEAMKRDPALHPFPPRPGTP